MISQTVEYGLRALAHIANDPEDYHLGRNVAAELGVPANYLSKILQTCARYGLLESQKGRGGGFRLAKPASGIHVADVIVALEGPQGPRACVFGKSICSDDDPCQLHEYWKQIRELHQQMAQKTSIADLTDKGMPEFIRTSPKSRGQNGDSKKRKTAKQ